MTMPSKFLLLLSSLIVITGCSTVSIETPKPIPVETAEQDAGPEYDDRALALFNEANLRRAEQPEQALQLYSEAIAEDDSIEPALFNLARMHFDSARVDDLVSLAQNHPATSARVWNLVGLSYRQQGQFEQARIAYEQALQIDNSHLNSLRNIAVLHDLYLHDLTTALNYYQQYQAALENQGQSNPELNNWLADLNQRLRGVGE